MDLEEVDTNSTTTVQPLNFIPNPDGSNVNKVAPDSASQMRSGNFEYADPVGHVFGRLGAKPDLIVDDGDLPATARAVRDMLAASGDLFERGVPVKLATCPKTGMPRVQQLTLSSVVIATHALCRPVKQHGPEKMVPVTLPNRVATMYLDMQGDRRLWPLVGITTAPVLRPDGDVRTVDGYDRATGLWCAMVPALQIPDQPNRTDAKAALLRIRRAFSTFPFADAARRPDKSPNIDVVNVDEPPGRDESAFLVGLMTAVCRPSLWLAPGLLVRAPEISGAGTGKGLLVRAICAIAFGVSPDAFSMGGDRQELDKRLAAELIEAAPVLFLDNVNAFVLRSDLLAQILTERPVRVRPLGLTRMAPLNSTAFVAITGNGLSIAEDLARRFIVCELDAHCENPEQREFGCGDFLAKIGRRRPELLTAALTIWRWGRQNTAHIERGRPLGSFEQWTEWCRDPLVALGCCDPVERIDAIKCDDPERRRTVQLFQTWNAHHKDRPTKVSELSEQVCAAAGSYSQSRQRLEVYLRRLTNTRAGGFVLTREESAGKWGAATYILRRTTGE